MAFENKVGARIRSYRERLNLSTAELAERCGIGESVVVSMESGEVLPSLGVLTSNALTAALKDVLPFKITPFTDIIWYVAGAFAAAGVVVGILGSLLSISRFLKREGNEILGW